MAFASVGHPSSNHICITNGLDLLYPIIRGKLVEARENPVQEPHHIMRWKPAGPWGEVNDVGEQDGHSIELVGNYLVRLIL